VTGVSEDTRARILRAAKELAEEQESVQGVTVSLESVSRRAGLTKQGLMYYYSSKENLMLGMVEHAAARWDGLLRDHTGAAPEALSVFERYRAYAAVATSAEVSRADYWVFSEALYHPKLGEPWHRFLSPWFAVDDVADESRSLLTAARFCADGAWMSEATGVFPAENLADVGVRAQELIDQAEAQGGYR
jgi:AcrR family transcriptional regulator